jgi:hypothetical protein
VPAVSIVIRPNASAIAARTRGRGDKTATTRSMAKSVRRPVGRRRVKISMGSKASLVPGGNAAFETGGSFSPTARKAVAIAASSLRAPRVRLFGCVSEEYHLIRRLDSHICSPVSPLGENTNNAQFERRRPEARAAETDSRKAAFRAWLPGPSITPVADMITTGET